MNEEAARPLRACTQTKLGMDSLRGAPNITPAPPIGICGQCRPLRRPPQRGQTRGRRERPPSHVAVQNANTKHPTASPNAGCGCRQHRIPPCRRHMPRQFPVRTHIPKIQNTLRPYKLYIFVRSPRWGSCAGGSAHQNFPNREKPLPLPEQPKPKAPAREGSQPHRRVLLCVRHTEKDAPKGVPYGEILWQACHSPASLGFPLSIPAACG